MAQEGVKTLKSNNFCFPMCYGCVLVGVKQIIFLSLIASQASSGLEAAHSEKCLGLLPEIAQNAHSNRIFMPKPNNLIVSYLIVFGRIMTS